MILLVTGLLNIEAQETAGYLTNVTVNGTNIAFDVVTPAPPGEWMLEAADRDFASASWSPLPDPAPSGSKHFLIPIDRRERYFRIRWNGWFSSNIAGYAQVAITTRLAMIANPFNHGNNTLAEVLPNVPEGCLLYKYDAVRQIWGSVSQFRLGEWDRPSETLAPGGGALFQSPNANLQTTFYGTISPSAPSPELHGGYNIFSLRAPLPPFALPPFVMYFLRNNG